MLRVLIVENEAELARFWASHLTESGYQVVGVCGSACDAIELARNLDPDVVLLDIMLDGSLDGFDVAAALRGSSDAHIIFMTAHCDLATIGRMQAAGGSYVEKPFRPASLVDAIEECRGTNEGGAMGFTTDHDLLVRLDTKLDSVTLQLTEARLLMSTKADSNRVDKLEKIIDGLNTKVLMGCGGAIAINLMLRVFWK